QGLRIIRTPPQATKPPSTGAMITVMTRPASPGRDPGRSGLAGLVLDATPPRTGRPPAPAARSASRGRRSRRRVRRGAGVCVHRGGHGYRGVCAGGPAVTGPRSPGAGAGGGEASAARTRAMTVPNAWPQNLGSAADWANLTTGQAEAGPVAYPRGRGVGGSGAINALARH